MIYFFLAIDGEKNLIILVAVKIRLILLQFTKLMAIQLQTYLKSMRKWNFNWDI